MKKIDLKIPTEKQIKEMRAHANKVVKQMIEKRTNAELKKIRLAKAKAKPKVSKSRTPRITPKTPRLRR